VRNILAKLNSLQHDIRTVCIGGINASNAQRVMYQSATLSKGLDGVAVVSAIVGAEDPKKAARDLRNLLARPPAFAAVKQEKQKLTRDVITSLGPQITKKLGEVTPLCHNMTNLVVQNFAANVALSM